MDDEAAIDLEPLTGFDRLAVQSVRVLAIAATICLVVAGASLPWIVAGVAASYALRWAAQ